MRALRLLTEQMLCEIIQSYIQSMDALQAHLDVLFDSSRTSKLWINAVIRPIFIMMKFVRAERENDFPLHLKAVQEAIPYFFSAGHVNYARYSIYYLRRIEALPDDVRHCFEKGEHTIHLKDGIWNGVW